MCRWAAYTGAPIFLEEIISRPGHSLIHQSHCATQCHSAINADGFGIAWYGTKSEPGLYRDVLPAWSDPNLRSLTAQVQSGLFLAHVRASTGTATSRNNCHPFTHGIWSFMHNGQVGGYDSFRRDADMMIPDALYAARKGATDSEALFLVAIAEGLERAAARFIRLAREKGAAPHLWMTAALSDGKNLYAVPCAMPPMTRHPRSITAGRRRAAAWPWCPNRWRPKRAAGSRCRRPVSAPSTAKLYCWKSFCPAVSPPWRREAILARSLMASRKSLI
jgi:predicted glutamine amidotransferase